VANQDGELIRHCRLDAGLTQAELARRLDTTQSAVARWESGKVSPTVANLRRILSTCGWELEITPAPSREDPGPAADRAGSGVDRTVIRELLALTPAERIGRAVDEGRAVEAIPIGIAWDQP